MTFNRRHRIKPYHDSAHETLMWGWPDKIDDRPRTPLSPEAIQDLTTECAEDTELGLPIQNSQYPVVIFEFLAQPYGSGSFRIFSSL